METAPPSAAPQVVDLGKMSLPRLMFALLHRRFTGTVGLQQPAPEAGARQITPHLRPGSSPSRPRA